MHWRDQVWDALHQLAAHKTRTLLTLLGMVFGVGAVIAMVSVGEGAEKEALRLIESMGARNVIIEQKALSDEMQKRVRKHSVGLSLSDADAVTLTLPQVRQYSAQIKIETHTLFSEQSTSNAQVMAVSQQELTLSSLTLATGRWFNEREQVKYAQVAVLGSQAARSLFGEDTPIGRVVKVNHVWLTVVGVLEAKHLSKDKLQGIQLETENNRIYIPLKTGLKRFNRKLIASELDVLKVQLDERLQPELAASVISDLLLKRHGQQQDFNIIVPAALLAQQKQTQRIFNIVMSCVAGISLVVGGIGIMNIMLATVLERTKEIGLLRAIGAKRSMIKRQFLIESFTISALGGVLGIILGYVLAFVISTYSGWPVAFSGGAVLLSVCFCAGVGLAFGIYPAIKAARLDPIQALHHD